MDVIQGALNWGDLRRKQITCESLKAMHFIEAMGLRVSITMITTWEESYISHSSSSRDVKSGDQDRNLKPGT